MRYALKKQNQMRSSTVLLLCLSMAAKRCATQFVLVQDFSNKRLCLDDCMSGDDDYDSDVDLQSSSYGNQKILKCLELEENILSLVVIVWEMRH